MKIKKEYFKTIICGVPYLLPYGQEIAAFAPNLKLNASAEFLWDALISGASLQSLPSLLLEKYGGTKEDLPLLTQDVDQFINMLKMQKILQPVTTETIPASYPLHHLQIASLNLAFCGPDTLYSAYFSDFTTEEASPADGEVFCIPYAPAHLSCGQILIRNEELTIAEDEDHFLFYFVNQNIYEMRVTKDGRQTWLFFNASAAVAAAASDENLFHALRFAFLVLAQKHDLYAIHSASLLYRDSAWLFSAPSGTGKTTHTALWKDQFKTPLLNGDLNILGLNGKIPTAYGLPWCGTSKIHTTANYPLGGIIFLMQAADNKILSLSPHEQVLNITQRMISPTWTQELLTQNLNFAERIVPQIFTVKLLCNPKPEAAMYMKNVIDDFLKK